MPIYLKEADVAELFDMPSAIEAVRAAFAARARGEAVIVPRTRWEFGDRRLNVMGGGVHTPNRYALKSYGSAAHHVLLYSAEQGLLAVIEANTLGQIRTGAATARSCCGRRWWSPTTSSRRSAKPANSSTSTRPAGSIG